MATTTLNGLGELLQRVGLEVPIPHFLGADVLTKPLDIGRVYLGNIISNLVESNAANAYRSIQWPGDINNGDLAIILPKFSPGADVDVLALDLMKRFPPCPLFILPFHEPESVHLRIMFKSQTLPRLLLPYINDRKGSYGRDPSVGLHASPSSKSGPQRVLVEFSSPNIASEFQGKHLRSTILGAYISDLHEAMGWDVVRINYLGDWGRPIGLLGTGWEKFGSESLFEADPAGHLLDVYTKINELFIPEVAASKKARDDGENTADIEANGIFAERNAFCKRLEEGEEKALKFWERVRCLSIDSYIKFYAQLNIHFDEYSGESQVYRKTMVEVEQILKSKGLVEESGGAWIIDMKKHAKKSSGMAIIRDRTGGSTYLLRDLAAVLDRSRKYSFDKMIYVVAADQHTVHFLRLFTILKLMDMSDLVDKLQYVNFSEAPHMSKNAIHGHMLGDIFQPYESAMADSLKEHPEKAHVFGDTAELSQALAITALLSQELSTRRANDHAFDIGQVTSFDPGTGPDLQYWYARLCSILEAGPSRTNVPEEELSSLRDENESDLLRLLIQYPDITHAAYQSLESAPIMSYLVNVTGQLSLCLGEDQGGCIPTPAQLSLYEVGRIVLENGMRLIGIIPAMK